MPTATPSTPRTRDLYVDGAWAAASGRERIPVFDPSTERPIASVPAGTPADVDRAVEAARAAFPAWAATSPAERADALARIAAGLTARREEIALTVTRELGTPLAQSRDLQAGMPLHNAAYYAGLARTYRFESEVGNSLLVREPVGVVGCITPWNFPLHQAVLKVAPALAAGCTVVLKPSEVAPLTAYLLAEVIDEAGLPPGVFNLVSGEGPVVGEAIAAHPGVDMVSFTGSNRAGTRVAAVAAATVKRVALELGGKSANIVLDDADFESVVTAGVAACFLNAGQNCAALSRLLVPRSRLAEVEEIAARAAAAETVGDPFDERTTLGPLVSEVQLGRVVELTEAGIAEGARLIAGGPERIRRPGWFVAPTIFSDVDPGMRIAREEIFGPVLSILGYADDDEAARIADDTDYGLFAGVWSADRERALAMARRLRAGQVSVNGGAFNLEAPFGGYKHSGVGREAGVWGLEECLEVKAIHR
jgi:betaine-aldehyde dehydrogenase